MIRVVVIYYRRVKSRNDHEYKVYSTTMIFRVPISDEKKHFPRQNLSNM